MSRIKRGALASVASLSILGTSILGATPSGAQEIPNSSQVQLPSPKKLAEKLGLPAPVLPMPHVASPAVVNADVAQNYVSFGDSVAANPTILDIAVQRQIDAHPELNLEWPTIRDGYCAQGPQNFPARAAIKTGLRLSDYSCGGATAIDHAGGSVIPSNSFPNQVHSAINRGDLNPNTQLVTISIGVNDLYQPGNLQFTPEAKKARQDRYVRTVTDQINKIRQQAPNAEIVLLGLPDQTDGQNHTCPTNFYGTVSHWYFPWVAYLQDELHEEQQRVAEATGIQYLDMRNEISYESGKNGCSLDPNRYSASIFDDSPHNFAVHLTDAGNEYYASRIADVYGS